MLTNVSSSYVVTNLDLYKIIGGNGCKYYLSLFHFPYLASARITSQLRKLNYDSPPIANKFSFIILQNKHAA